MKDVLIFYELPVKGRYKRSMFTKLIFRGKIDMILGD